MCWRNWLSWIRSCFYKEELAQEVTIDNREPDGNILDYSSRTSLNVSRKQQKPLPEVVNINRIEQGLEQNAINNKNMEQTLEQSEVNSTQIQLKMAESDNSSKSSISTETFDHLLNIDALKRYVIGPEKQRKTEDGRKTNSRSADQDDIKENSRSVDEYIVKEFCDYISYRLAAFQDERRGKNYAETHELLKDVGDGVKQHVRDSVMQHVRDSVMKHVRDSVMKHAKEEGFLHETPNCTEMERTKEQKEWTEEQKVTIRVGELLWYHINVFNELLSSLESCTTGINEVTDSNHKQNETQKLVELGDVLVVPDIIGDSKLLKSLDPLIKYWKGICCSDEGYRNHCYDATQQLYAGTVNCKFTGTLPTYHKPVYLISYSYLSQLSMFKELTLKFLYKLQHVFRKAILAKYPEAKVDKYDDNVSKLRESIKDLFDDFELRLRHVTNELITEDFNKRIHHMKDTFAGLGDLREYKPGMIKKYMDSGADDDLDLLIENHAKILQNLREICKHEIAISDLLKKALPITLVSFFQYKMIDDDVD